MSELAERQLPENGDTNSLEDTDSAVEVPSYYVRVHKNFCTIQLVRPLNKQDNISFNQAIVNAILNPRHLVFDCFFVEEIPVPILMGLSFLQKQIAAEAKLLQITNCSPELKENLKMVTFSDEHFFAPNFLSAVKLFKSAKSELPKYSIVSAIVMSTNKTFYIQSGTICARRKTYFKEENKNEFLGDISSFVRVDTDEKYYFFTLSFAKKAYLNVMSVMLGDKITEIDEEVEDGVSEVLSIVLGQTRNFLMRSDRHLATNFPRVITDKECPKIENDEQLGNFDFSSATVFVLPFNSAHGKFFIELAFPKEYSMDEITNLVLK